MAQLFQITLCCKGIPEEHGVSSAVDVASEIRSRPWYRNSETWWSAGELFLKAENDYDDSGEAMLDEFSDAVVACATLGDGDVSFRIHAIVMLGESGVRFDPGTVAWLQERRTV